MADVTELWERELLNERFGPVWMVRKEAMRRPNPILRDIHNKSTTPSTDNPQANRDTVEQQKDRQAVLMGIEERAALGTGTGAAA